MINKTHKQNKKENKFEPYRNVHSLYCIKNKVNLSSKWIQNYSKYKMGYWKALIWWEKLIIKKIKKEIGKEIKMCPGKWVVVIKKLWRIPSASFNLAEDISKKLGLNSIVIESIIPDSKLTEGDYAKLSTKEQRIANIKKTIKYKTNVLINKKNVIFIDDSYVSGTVLNAIKNETFSKGAKTFYSFVIIDMSKIKDYSLEDVINRAAIQKNLFLKILNDRNSIITSKLICYISELNNKDLQKMCIKLSKFARKKLNYYAILKGKENISKVLNNLNG